jgi:hypothetical protein
MRPNPRWTAARAGSHTRELADGLRRGAVELRRPLGLQHVRHIMHAGRKTFKWSFLGSSVYAYYACLCGPV